MSEDRPEQDVPDESEDEEVLGPHLLAGRTPNVPVVSFGPPPSPGRLPEFKRKRSEDDEPRLL